MPLLEYSPGFYDQYSPPVSKPSDGGLPMYPDLLYLLASVPFQPPQIHMASEGDNHGHGAQEFYLAPFFAPEGTGLPDRSDGLHVIYNP